MDILISILAFIVLFMVLVSVHEGAHFWAGRMGGMKILEFSIGMGPAIYKRTTKEGMLFSIRALPLGGYVKPLDKTAVTEEEWEALSEAEKARSFSQVSRAKRAFMVAAGPLSNLLLAFFILVAIPMVVGEKDVLPIVGDVLSGSQAEKAGFKKGDIIRFVNDEKIERMDDLLESIDQSLDSGAPIKIKTNNQDEITIQNAKANPMGIAGILGFRPKMNDGPGLVSAIKKDGAAYKAGIRKGDVIKKIGDNTLDDTTKIRSIVTSLQGTQFDITLERNKREELVTVNLPKDELLGLSVITPNNNHLKTFKRGLSDSIAKAYDQVHFMTSLTFKWFKEAFGGNVKVEEMGGPVSIADASGQAMRIGVERYLYVLAAVSLSLGIMNLLPVPVLDGGHLVILSIEGALNRDMPEFVSKAMNYAGALCVIGLMGLSVFADIERYILK